MSKTSNDKESLYKYIGELALMEKVKYITTWSVVIFIVAALFIVASIVLFFLMESLLWPTLILVAGVIIAVVAGLLRSITGGKLERQYKTPAALSLGEENYSKFVSSSEEKYKTLAGPFKCDQDIYNYFKPIEFIILISLHLKEVNALTHEFKRKGYSYSLTLDNSVSFTIILNPINEIEETISSYLDVYIEKEIVNREISQSEISTSE